MNKQRRQEIYNAQTFIQTAKTDVEAWLDGVDIKDDEQGFLEEVVAELESARGVIQATHDEEAEYYEGQYERFPTAERTEQAQEAVDSLDRANYELGRIIDQLTSPANVRENREEILTMLDEIDGELENAAQ